jgi:hypothetical protein
MKTIISLAVLATLSLASFQNCAETYTTLPMVVVAPQLMPFVRQFEIEFNTVNKSNVYLVTSIVGGPPANPAGHTVGFCSFLGSELVIQIDKDYFDSCDETMKEQLLYHELAHCNFRMPHDTRRDDETKRPLSVMFPSQVSEQQYVRYHSDYMKDLHQKIGR